MSRGGYRPNSGPPRTKRSLIAEAAGIMHMQALRLYMIGISRGPLSPQAMREISRTMLRETMAARRRIQKVLLRTGRADGARRP